MEQFDKHANLLKKLIGPKRHLVFTQLGTGQWSSAAVDNECDPGAVVAEAVGDTVLVATSQLFELCTLMRQSGKLRQA